jgi:hypothetical protein
LIADSLSLPPDDIREETIADYVGRQDSPDGTDPMAR